MSRSDHSADISADVALDGDSATVHIVEMRTLDLDDLFRDVPNDDSPADARLQLWSDAAGWNGYELRDGEVVTLEDGLEEVGGAGDVFAGVRDGVGPVAVVVVRRVVNRVVPPLGAVVGPDANAAWNLSSGRGRDVIVLLS